MNKTTDGAKDNDPPKNQAATNHYQGRGAFVDDGGIGSYTKFFRFVNEATTNTQVKVCGESTLLVNGLEFCKRLFAQAHSSGNRVIFIGNGGSAAIASHMAVDYTKNGGIRAIAFNDVPTLTCLGNDFGYDQIFAKQIEYYAQPKDVIVIISSSGKSPNILLAAEQAFKQGLDLVTFSGQNPGNVLRSKGVANFYVPAQDYGLVELAHLCLLHSIVSMPYGK